MLNYKIMWYYPSSCQKWSRKHWKTGQDSLCDMNLEPPEYEAGILPTQLWCLVNI